MNLEDDATENGYLGNDPSGTISSHGNLAGQFVYQVQTITPTDLLINQEEDVLNLAELDDYAAGLKRITEELWDSASRALR